LGEEDEGGKAVLGASLEEVGVAQNGGERRRPWRRLGYWEKTGKRGRARERES
jgi:hypothetical protein